MTQINFDEDELQENESFHARVMAVVKVVALFSFAFILLGYLFIRTKLIPNRVNQVTVNNNFGKIVVCLVFHK